jgi:hypothetical protein
MDCTGFMELKMMMMMMMMMMLDYAKVQKM